MNYSEAVTKLGNRSSRKLANNTYLQRRDDNAIALRYHATDVLLFTPKFVEYNSGGWFTYSTKDRMNYGPVSISSDRGRWFVYPKTAAGLPDWNCGGYFYFDGIRVSNDGRKILKPTAPREISDNSAMKKEINAFVSSAIVALRESLPMPSGGDCWFCAMKDKDGKTLGDLGSTDHLIEHMREGYIVPSLLWNAISEAGYRYPEIILGAYENGNGGYRLGGMTNDTLNNRGEIVLGRPRAIEDSVSRALRRYLKRRLVPNEIA